MWRTRRVGGSAGDRHGLSVLPLLVGGTDEEFRVGHDLFDGRHVHLARAEAGGALFVANLVPMGLAGRLEVDRLRILLEDVADDLAVLTEEQTAIRIQHQTVGVGFSRVSDSADVAVAGTVPHPLFFDQLRGASAQASGLSRTETAVHLQLIYMAVVTNEIDVAISVGPSFFSVTQDIVSAVAVQEGAAPFEVVTAATATTTEVNDRAVGFNVGADMTYRFMPNLGAGLFLRYAAASVDLPSTSSDAGGFQVGIGLRARF